MRENSMQLFGEMQHGKPGHSANTKSGTPLRLVLLAALVAGITPDTQAQAQPDQVQARHSAAQTVAPSATRKVSPFLHASKSSSAQNYYQSVWGIDNLLVRRTASGNLIRFSYRVTDPARAKVLGDEHATPYLYGQRSRAVLHVPVMDKVGKLRQTGTAESGKEYWMVFSNKGDLIKSGDRVNVTIGSFHADGMTVE
jgi:hypothetical protein